MAKINKLLTRKLIIKKAKESRTMKINIELFDEKIVSDDDYRSACKYVRVKPIYFKKGEI